MGTTFQDRTPFTFSLCPRSPPPCRHSTYHQSLLLRESHLFGVIGLRRGTRLPVRASAVCSGPRFNGSVPAFPPLHLRHDAAPRCAGCCCRARPPHHGGRDQGSKGGTLRALCPPRLRQPGGRRGAVHSASGGGPFRWSLRFRGGSTTQPVFEDVGFMPIILIPLRATMPTILSAKLDMCANILYLRSWILFLPGLPRRRSAGPRPEAHNLIREAGYVCQHSLFAKLDTFSPRFAHAGGCITLDSNPPPPDFEDFRDFQPPKSSKGISEIFTTGGCSYLE